MAQRVDFGNYPDLGSFGILSNVGGEISTAVGVTKLTVSNGLWGSDVSSPALYGRGFPNGQYTNPIVFSTARDQVLAVKAQMDGFTPDTTDYPGAAPVGGGTIVLTPGIYKSASTGGIVFGESIAGANGVRLELDASNNPTGQFIFISTGDIIFNNLIDIVLTNGAKSDNVFWYSTGSNSIVFSGDKPTAFVGTVLTVADFAVTSPIDFNGRIYGRNIQFVGSGASSVILPYNPSYNNNIPVSIKDKNFLEQFALLGADDLVILGTDDFEIANGYWGTATSKAISGQIVAAPGDTFSRLDTTKYNAAITQRDEVVASIVDLEFSDTGFGGVSTNQTLQPGVYTGTNMRFGAPNGAPNNINITLDANGYETAQFIFYATGDIEITDLNQIAYINGALGENVIFYAEGNISIGINLQAPGNFNCTFISEGTTSFDDGVTLTGRVLSNGTFTASNGFSISSNYVPPAPFLPILFSEYATLSQYAIHTLADISATNGLTISNGFYGVGTTVTGPITSLGNPNGRNDNVSPGVNSLYDAAVEQRDQLIANIYPRSQSGDVIPYTGGSSGTTIYLDPGVYYSASSINFSISDIYLDAEGDSTAQFFFIADTAITFTNVTAINLLNGALPENVFWLATTSINFTENLPPSVPGTLITIDESITFSAAITVNSRILSGAGVTFAGVSSVTLPGDIPCYLKGTQILTDKGYVPVETIDLGDHVATFADIDSENTVTVRKPTFQPCVSIRTHTIGEVSSKSRPVLFKAGSLGDGLPEKDLCVSPNHGVYFDKYLRLASSFLNGESVVSDVECKKPEYYHLELESHVCVKASGVLAESLNMS